MSIRTVVIIILKSKFPKHIQIYVETKLGDTPKSQVSAVTYPFPDDAIRVQPVNNG